MPAAINGRRLLISAILLLAVSCAAVRADDDGVISPEDALGPADGTENEQTLKRPCAAFYRLDDVTEMNDEIRRCLMPSWDGTADL